MVLGPQIVVRDAAAVACREGGPPDGVEERQPPARSYHPCQFSQIGTGVRQMGDQPGPEYRVQHP